MRRRDPCDDRGYRYNRGTAVNRTDRNATIVANLPLVGYLVSTVMASATHLSRDDLAQAGSIALVLAVEQFDPERGVPFGAYARERIIGAIKDEMRADDWAKRTTRTTIRVTLATKETLTAQLGRTPTVSELAGALGVDRQSASDALAMAERTVSTLDTGIAESIASSVALPDEELVVAERMEYLRAAVASLPERLRHVVTEIYLAGRSVGELAEELGVTHSAVSQQRSEAVSLMRSAFARFYEESLVTPHPTEPARLPARHRAYLAAFAESIGMGRSAIA